MNANPLSSLLVVELEISEWSGRAGDKNRAVELERATGARAGTANVTKKIADLPAMAGIKTVVRSARALLERGQSFGRGRYLFTPAYVAETLLPELREKETEFSSLVATLEDQYRDYLRNDPRTVLGELADGVRFPSEIGSRFRFSARFYPADTGETLIAGLSQDLADKIEAEISRSVRERMADTLSGIRETLENEARNCSACMKTRIQDGLFSRVRLAAEIAESTGLPEGKAILEILRNETETTVSKDKILRRMLSESIDAVFPPVPAPVPVLVSDEDLDWLFGGKE